MGPSTRTTFEADQGKLVCNREEVLKIIRSRRRYASYWEWRDQPSTELSVLETYCETRERQEWPRFVKGIGRLRIRLINKGKKAAT